MSSSDKLPETRKSTGYYKFTKEELEKKSEVKYDDNGEQKASILS